MFEKYFEKRQDKKEQSYQEALQADEKVYQAQKDLEKSVNELSNVDLQIEIDNTERKINLEEKKLEYANLKQNSEAMAEATNNIQNHKNRLAELQQQLDQKRHEQEPSK